MRSRTGQTRHLTLIRPEPSLNLALLSGLSLSSVLQECTVGVALFDTELYCAAVNSVLCSMSSLPANAYVGKTPRQIFAVLSAPLEQAIQSVQATQKSVRNVRATVQLAGTAVTREWIADLFPLCDTAKKVRWIGTAFSEAPRKSRLPYELSNPPHLNGSSRSPDRPPADQSFEPPVSLAATCNFLFERTFTLLDNSMSLRRRVSEMRLAASVLRSARSAPTRSPNLSSREEEVVRFLASGKSNKEIAATLALSTRTVETYRARLMRKLHFHSLADVIRYAIRNRLIDT